MYSVPTEITRKTDSFSECYMHTQTRTIRDEALVATAMSPVNPYSCVQIEEHACITLVPTRMLASNTFVFALVMQSLLRAL